MNNPEIQLIADDVKAIETLLKDELEGLEGMILLHGDDIAMIDGRSQENVNVIRAIVRRFEKKFRDQEKRISDLENRHGK